ncbi:unannotated protein [freshwater metagenome]|uniref:methionyl-tRNA formyltransferase n=1 Tax=freshwater metagenome TaxID=449393 RepID=A0A6J6MWA0_9ZZZZ|nr:methionyl-tRNA formyltransferase [Actinomycetota bacterium]MSZ05991.1 methionyl-tRNA formyltransferase [Actinomycetota bacterium]
MRIGVAATPQVAIPTLDWLLTTSHELAMVITQPDRPAGRGRDLTESPVSAWATSHGITCIKPLAPSELAHVVNDLDLVLTIGYGVILPEEILQLPRFGFLNLHFSLLPAYRGAAPVQRALENGEVTSGLTVFQLDKGMDTGPLFTQIPVGIEPTWRSFEMLEHLARMGPEAFAHTLVKIEQGIKPEPQRGSASIAPKISKEQAKIVWSDSAQAVINRIRAFYPAPCAWSTWKENPIKITQASMAQIDLELKPGQIHCQESKVFVGAALNGVIELGSVIPAGKSEMPAADWARGAHLLGGENFG